MYNNVKKLIIQRIEILIELSELEGAQTAVVKVFTYLVEQCRTLSLNVAELLSLWHMQFPSPDYTSE